MNKPTLVIGILAIIGMCLVPPYQVTRYHDMDGMLGHHWHHTTIEYHIVGTAPLSFPSRKHAGGWQLASTRLLLQVVVVSIVCGGLAYIIGAEKRHEEE